MLWNAHGFLNLLFQATSCITIPIFIDFKWNYESIMYLLSDGVTLLSLGIFQEILWFWSLLIFPWTLECTCLILKYLWWYFYGHCFPLTQFPYIQYIILCYFFFLSGNVFLCDVGIEPSVTRLLGKYSTAELCPLGIWYVPRNMCMFLQIDLACFLHDCFPRYFCLLEL